MGLQLKWCATDKKYFWIVRPHDRYMQEKQIYVISANELVIAYYEHMGLIWLIGQQTKVFVQCKIITTLFFEEKMKQDTFIQFVLFTRCYKRQQRVKLWLVSMLWFRQLSSRPFTSQMALKWYYWQFWLRQFFHYLILRFIKQRCSLVINFYRIKKYE